VWLSHIVEFRPYSSGNSPVSILRISTYLGVLVLAAIGSSTGVLAFGGLDIFQTQEHREEMKRHVEYGKQLDLIDQELRRHIRIKDQLIIELIAGKKTLTEVTTEFLVLNQSQAATMDVLRREYPGLTDEEKIARNVIEYATADLDHSYADQKEVVLARLEAEFEQLQKRSISALPCGQE
jgi:hypothetical protein